MRRKRAVPMHFGDAVTINPPVHLDKGKIYPFVEMAAVTPGTRSVTESERRAFRSGGAKFRLGDTLMARITPCLENGKIARFYPSDGSDMGFGSTEFIVIRGKRSTTTDDFAYYLTQWSEFRQFAIGQMTGTSGRQRVPADALAGFDVRIPPIPVQNKITAVLGRLDDKIELNRRMIGTLKKMAAATFKSWFIDFDPVHNKAEGRETGLPLEIADLFPSEFQGSGHGPIPRGWSWSTLGAICESHGGFVQTGPFGSQLHASDYIPTGTPVVMPQDISGRHVVEDRIARISATDADRLGRHKLRPGDIVFSRRGDVGRHAVTSEREEGWLCGTGCLLVRPGDSNPPSAFVSAALAESDARAWLIQHAVGATMPNLNTSILSDIPLILPADSLVQCYERVVAHIEHSISANLVQADTLSKLRDTLLPTLLTGEVEMAIAQAKVEGVAA